MLGFCDSEALGKLTRYSRFSNVLGEDVMGVAEVVPTGVAVGGEMGGSCREWEGGLAGTVVCVWVDAEYSMGRVSLRIDARTGMRRWSGR